MTTATDSQPVIVHTHEGVICDSIEFQIGDGPKCSFPNSKAGWSAINTHARLHGGFVRHNKWDGTYEEVKWLESAPYKHRQKWLDANFNAILDKVTT